MNTAGLLIIWTFLQVSAFCAVGCLVYLAARRHNPAAGAWAATSVLAVALCISAFAISPWPRWWSLAESNPPDATDRSTAAPGLTGTPGASRLPDLSLFRGLKENREPSDVDAKTAAPANDKHRDWRSLWSSLKAAIAVPVSSEASAWHWPAWLALAVMLGCTLCLARLLVGLTALSGYRRLTRRVDDVELNRLLEQLRGELNCTRSIELREAAVECSPAAIGWLRPLVVLPSDWRAWSPQDRRAVLAHEIAHVARADFAWWIMAQLSLALHFYNPLVRWLAGRLRFEQELAADLDGAHLAGGRQAYLNTLATMALRRDRAPMAWAANPFLPNRGALMRRIEMLHHQQTLPARALSIPRKMLVALLLVLGGWLVVGVRGPAGPALSAASGPPNVVFSGKQNTERTPLSLEFVPADALAVIVARPSELAGLKSLASLKTALTQLGLAGHLGMPLEDLAEFRYVLAGDAKPKARQEDRPWSVMVLRSLKPYDWSKFADSVVGTPAPATAQGQVFFQRPNAVGPFSAWWRPDDRTIVLTSAAKVQSTFTLNKPSIPAWSEQWNQVAGSPVAAFAKSVMLQPALATVYSLSGETAPNLAELTDAVLFQGNDVAGGFQVTGTISARAPENLEKLAAVLRRGLDGLKQELAPDLNRGPIATNFGASGFARLLAYVVNATTIEVKSGAVLMTTLVSADVGQQLTEAVGPARMAAMRQRSVNTLKLLGLALHNYHDKHGHFPAADVLGPDGKTPHSWRVELLPYLGHAKLDELAKRYKLDEPWDSENNRQVMVEGAEYFSVPSEKPSQDCGYFVLTGPGTVFDPAQPPSKLRNITDGSSNTIGIVEAKRAIPWTKPEDIEYDPAKPVPAFGGHFEGGFNAAVMDGSVHFLALDLDEATLRALISKGGREIIGNDAGGRPKVQQ